MGVFSLPQIFLVFFSVAAASVFAQDACIRTAEEYFLYYDEHQPAPCVDPSLYVTLQGPCDCALNEAECAGTVSEKELNTFGWISGSVNLEVYLGFNNEYPDDPFSAVSAMLRYVGFPSSSIDASCSYRMAVMERSGLEAARADLFAPTFVAWWPETRDRFGIEFGPAAEREVSLYGFAGFDEMTGCEGRVAEPPGVCGEEFEEARGIMEAAKASGGTEACASAFGSSYGGGASASPAQIRAFLYVCYECNSYNTGNGYGFDGGDFTDAEYVVENKLLEEELGAVVRRIYPI